MPSERSSWLPQPLLAYELVAAVLSVWRTNIRGQHASRSCSVLPNEYSAVRSGPLPGWQHPHHSFAASHLPIWPTKTRRAASWRYER